MGSSIEMNGDTHSFKAAMHASEHAQIARSDQNLEQMLLKDTEGGL